MEGSQSIESESLPLYLPSQLPQNTWQTGCIAGLHGLELELRIAQANDTLDNLRRQLCIYTGLVTYKRTQVQGRGLQANARARGILLRCIKKARLFAEWY